MQSTNIVFFGLRVLFILDQAKGCPPNRRKRDIADPSAPELNQEIASFFGSCPDLVNASRDIFESLQSAVDYVLRDTIWYNETATFMCSVDNNDNPQCWIYALNFLLNGESVLFTSAAQCICNWFGTCYDIGGTVSKRAAGEHFPDFPPPEPARPPPPENPAKLSLSKCLEDEAKKLVFQYPSTCRVNGRTIQTFLEDHYTYCRPAPRFPYEQRNIFRLLYVNRLCPVSGMQAAWRNNFTTLFSEATRTDGPLWAAYQICKDHPLDECVPNPCKNGGLCENSKFGNYECLCRRGYHGRHCEKRICKDRYPYRCSYSSREDCRYPDFRSFCRATCGDCMRY